MPESDIERSSDSLALCVLALFIAITVHTASQLELVDQFVRREKFIKLVDCLSDGRIGVQTFVTMQSVSQFASMFVHFVDLFYC